MIEMVPLPVHPESLKADKVYPPHPECQLGKLGDDAIFAYSAGAGKMRDIPGFPPARE